MEALLGGFIVGYLYLKTKTLTAPIFAHFTGNIIERVVLLFLKF
jgi:membrane protease YdiL (CAAX protease family)